MLVDHLWVPLTVGGLVALFLVGIAILPDVGDE